MIAANPLRFIRSSSSSLPPQVIRELEATVRRASHRVLRHDRGVASDGEQPAAPAASASRHGRRRRRSRGRHHGRTGQTAAAGRDRARSSSAATTSRTATRTTPSQCRGLHQRLVPHRRPGHDGRRRLRHHHRPAEGDHQPRRREDLAARGRRGADGPSGGRSKSSRSRSRTSSWARRSPRRWCCARAPA